MTWTASINRYFATRDVRPQYERDTRHRANALEAFAGVPLKMQDVDAELANAFLASLQAKGIYSGKTLKGYRDAILCIWREAWNDGLTPHRPERVKAFKTRRHLPKAWTIDEVRQLVAAAKTLRGNVWGLGVSRATWFEAYVRLLWCTGLRAGDVLRLEWSQVNGGQIAVSQSKTSHAILCVLSEPATRLVDAIRLRTDSPLVLPWPGARCILDRWFRRLVRKAGIREGGTRWIRRSAASYVERDQPGRAGQFLGHLTPGLAARHYLDLSITRVAAVSPPEL